MNFVDIIGGSKKQRDLINDVVYFCINRLMPKMKTLDIEIQVNNIKGGAVGYCMMSENNRTFELEVDKKLDTKEMITTICHEMVHVKQYARNELGIDDYDPDASLNPADFPYEKEAYELQEILLREYQMRQR
tara:strand:+ start:1224 stop:1619 length:396 start_codon:yes stop_codon:yes gene_type:complete